MTVILFLIFVAVMAATVGAVFARYFKSRTALAVSAGLVAWLIYVGLIGYFGVVRNTELRPPGIAFLFVPIVLFLVLFIVRFSRVSIAAITVPLWLLLALQTFRVGVELFLHQLWIEGLIPRMLTYSGANLDIYIGATAPLIAWLSLRGRNGRRVALAWNWLGLLVLANVVVRAVLTAPGPFNRIHAEVPNLMIGTFPYMFIPGFFVPLAIVLHVVAIGRSRLPQGAAQDRPKPVPEQER